MNKKCSLCGEAKPLESFHKDRAQPSGRKTYCKACDKAKFYERRIEARKTADGRARRSNWRRARELSELKRAGERRHSKKRSALYPENSAATAAVSKALKSGLLVRPEICEVCLTNPGRGRRGQSLIQAHHDDYSEQLSVRWLCIMCHAAHHNNQPGSLSNHKGTAGGA